MGKVFAVVSGKGGTGKSTAAVLLASRYAEKNEKTLLIDMACGEKALDLFLGAENSAFYNIYDVLKEKCSLENAVITKGSLDFLPASQLHIPGEDDLPAFEKFLENERQRYSCIFLDFGGITENRLPGFIRKADKIIFAMTQDPASLRAADRLNFSLRSEKCPDAVILLNRVVHPDTGSAGITTPAELSDLLGFPVAGMIPESREIREHVLLGDVTGPLTEKNEIILKDICERLKNDTCPAPDEMVLPDEKYTAESHAPETSEMKRTGFLAGILGRFAKNN